MDGRNPDIFLSDGVTESIKRFKMLPYLVLHDFQSTFCMAGPRHFVLHSDF